MCQGVEVLFFGGRGNLTSRCARRKKAKAHAWLGLPVLWWVWFDAFNPHGIHVLYVYVIPKENPAKNGARIFILRPVDGWLGDLLPNCLWLFPSYMLLLILCLFGVSLFPRPFAHSSTNCRKGHAPNSSTGEFSHQVHKRGNTDNSFRNAALHYIVSANTAYGWKALADGVSWNVMKRNYKAGRTEEVTVRPGKGCSRVLQTLAKGRPGGLVGAPDIRAESASSKAKAHGSHQGPALWEAALKQDGDIEASTGVDGTSPSWDEIVRTGRFRPTHKSLLAAYSAAFGCGKGGGGVQSADPCADDRCPQCWENPSQLKNTTIRCSRFNHFAPLVASSGLGRWKGGDARSAGATNNAGCLSDAWVLGDKGGEDVEVWRTKPLADDDGRKVNVGNLSMGKIVYFFEHVANSRPDRLVGPPEATRWVLVFEYASAGLGNARSPDAATSHPMLRLRGNGEPVVFPAENIRRHVHLYHRCPEPRAGGATADDATEDVCGVVPATGADKGNSAPAWGHVFKLARRRLPGERGARPEDVYLLNEHHHSICRDSFID